MDNQKKSVKGIIISAVFLLILIALTYFLLFQRFDINEIIKIIAGANKTYIEIGFSMIFIYLFCYGLFAKVFLKTRGYSVSFGRGFIYATTDFYFSAITPSASGGQPMVIYYMSKDGIPVSDGFLSTFLHTTVFKIVLLILNAFSIIFFWGVWYKAGWLFISFWLLGLVISLGVIFITFLSMFKRETASRIGKVIIKALCRIKIIKDAEKKTAKFEKTLCDYQNAADELKGKRRLLLKLFIIVFCQRIAYFSVAFIVYCSFGFSGYGYFYFLAIQVFIALAVDSLPLPGGMGVNEAAIIFMYDSTFGSQKAAGAMILIRFVNYYSGLVIASIATIINHLYHFFRGKRAAR